MHDSQSNTKIPFMKSDRYLIIFLIIALLLVNAILNLLFGQTSCRVTKFTFTTSHVVDAFNASTTSLLNVYDIIDKKKMVLLK